jgi:hypothetical protein
MCWIYSGDYYVRVYWSKLPIDKFPIIATAVANVHSPASLPLPCVPVPELPQIRPDLVSVHGPGLSTARVLDPSDFVVDGHEAGPGRRQYCNRNDSPFVFVSSYYRTFLKNPIK